MKNETETPDQFPGVKEEKLKAANLRREKYSLVRDLQAKENNEAIARRLSKEKSENLPTE